jgi:2'-5' RNA ligase
MREFLAIRLPDALRRRAASLEHALALPPESWRFVREEGLHLTLRFLGEVDPARHDRLDRGWREAAHGTGPLGLRVDGAAVAPSFRQPRIVWLTVHDETSDDALARLAARIERAARAEGFSPEDRPFTGHVTLARARRGARVLEPDVSAVGELGRFVATRLTLYRSRLTSAGAIYEELASYPLDGGGPP